MTRKAKQLCQCAALRNKGVCNWCIDRWIARKSKEIRMHYLKHFADAARALGVSVSHFRRHVLRAIAERNPNFAGVDEPKWEIETYTDKQGKTQKHPVSCTVTAWRSDRPRPAVYTARYDEFVQLRDGNPTKMWAEKPFLMLEKCAEANALAKLFPEQQEESEIAKLIADAQIVQAEFAADETAEPAAPQLPGQSEIAKEHLAAILGSESVEQLEAVGNRLAALEIGEGDARYLRDHYKQRLKALGAA